MNKNIIIAIIVVIIIAIVGFMMFSQPSESNVNTQIRMLNEKTLKNGDQIQFQLKDTQGNLISGETVNISIGDGAGNIKNYTVVTDSNGKGNHVLEGEDAGEHEVTVTYVGNEKYIKSRFTETITIDDST